MTVKYEAYAGYWTPFNVYQGWVARVWEDRTPVHRTHVLVTTNSNLHVLMEELGFGRDDLDWQIQAEEEGDWELTWEGVLNNIRPVNGTELEIKDNPILVDPVLGQIPTRYLTIYEYRDEFPGYKWKFNPWTGEHRKPEDINNDPQGLIAYP